MGTKLNLENGQDRPVVSIDLDDGAVTLQEGTLSVDEWLQLTARVNVALVRAKIVEPPKQLPRSHGGPVSPAPWFLRPWFDKVIKKARRY